MSSAKAYFSLVFTFRSNSVCNRGTRILISLLLYLLPFPAWERLCVCPVCLTLILPNSSPFGSPCPVNWRARWLKCWRYWAGLLSAALKSCGLPIATKVVSTLPCTSTYSEQKGEKTDTSETAPQLSEQQLQYRTTQDPRLWSAAQQSYNLELEYFPMHYDTKWLMSAAWFAFSLSHPRTLCDLGKKQTCQCNMSKSWGTKKELEHILIDDQIL